MNRLQTLTFILLTAGCNAAGGETINLRSVYQNQYCASQAPGIFLLNKEDFSQLAGSRGLADRLGAAPSTIPEVADTEQLILISLGEKPSGGYAVALAARKAAAADGILELPLKVQQPEPGSVQTQQITSPCLVVAVSQSGYHTVRSRLFPEASLSVKE